MSKPLRYELTREQRNVIAAIKGLKAARRVSTEELCQITHLSRPTWFVRMNDCELTVWQMAAIAKRFGVTVQDLYDGMGLITVEGTQAYIAPELLLVQGEGGISPPIGELRVVR